MSFHSAEYKALALPGMNFGIDVVAHEGGLRFEEHKTIGEVLEDLHDIKKKKLIERKHLEK